MKEIILVMKEMLEATEEQHGAGVCDCRPEPENAGHTCCYCKARAIIDQFDADVAQKQRAWNAISYTPSRSIV